MKHQRQVTGLAVALLGMSLLAGRPAAAGDFTVEYHEGIEQNRNFEVDQMEDRQWVRVIGPTMTPFLQVVHVPEDWPDRPKEKRSTLTVSERNAAHVAVFATALEALEPAVVADFDLGARVVSSLQAVTDGEHTFAPRYERVWEIWEVLVNAVNADTLSISFAAVQTLHHLGVPAKLALYPVGERLVFGVLIDAEVPEATKDGLVIQQVGGTTSLFAVDRRAAPEAPIDPATVASWSWVEVTAIDWDPEVPIVAPHRPPGGDPDAPDARQQPDICDQAAAQGIECRSTRGDEKLMIAASVGLLVLLVLWGVLAWRRRRERLRRVAAAKSAKNETEF